MRSQTFWLTMLLLLALAPGCRGRAVASPAEKKTKPGDHLRKISHDGKERSYLLHIPPAYDGSKKLPLLIALHGGGGSGPGHARHSGLSETADREGFVVVYPNGSGRFGDKLLTWNSGNCCGYALDQNIDDVGFIKALIEALTTGLQIDPKRVFVTGMSNGGMMTYRLACELSDKIAAISPVAGALNVECKPSAPVSVIVFHGLADERVLYEGGEPKKRADRGHPRTDNSVEYAVSFWTKHNRCPGETKSEEVKSATHTVFEGCQDGSAVELYAIRDEGHTWPGGQKGTPWGDEPSREIKANELMWEFFQKHPKP